MGALISFPKTSTLIHDQNLIMPKKIINDEGIIDLNSSIGDTLNDIADLEKSKSYEKFNKNDLMYLTKRYKAAFGGKSGFDPNKSKPHLIKMLRNIVNGEI